MSKKWLFSVAAVVLLALVAIGGWYWSGMASRNPAPALVKIGYLPIASDASFFVAIENGLFSAKGLSVRPVKFETSSQALEALAAGRVDATAIVALESVLALEANTPGQFLIVEMTAATDKTRVHRILVKSNSPIHKLEDLKGKTVGTFPGTQMPIFLKLILGKFFDATKDLRIVQLKPELQAQALESGQIDGLFCLEPVCTLIESRGIGIEISVNPLYKFIQQPFPTAASLVSKQVAISRPAVLRSMEEALQAAHVLIAQHPLESASALSKFTPIDIKLAPKVALYDYWSLDEIDREAVQKLADLYTQTGVISKRVTTEGLYAKAADH
jgi:ABC-type nitrate/sulfonate/bicarbonate transport system substrate-binding protein